MSDPKRFIDTARIVAKVKFDKTQEVIDLHAIVDAEKYRKLPPEVAEQITKQEIGKISLAPSTVIYSTITSYSYSDRDAIKDFNFGNILIEAHIPYCLHLPNHTELEVSLTDSQLDALVILEKIWTNRAQTEKGKSNSTDFFTEDKTLYHKDIEIIGPVQPFRDEDGWDSFITGRNVEKLNDRNGLFRYSKLYIQFNNILPDKINEANDSVRNRLFKEIHDKALSVVNRLIDNYREITNEIYVRRLGSLKINLIYFIPQDIGFYITNPNITTAVMNRSEKELKKLKSRLKSGYKPELYKLLRHNAKNSVDLKEYTQAIVESYQALEIMLENFLIVVLRKRGDKEGDIKNFLDKNWRTKDRLNMVLKNLKGKALNENTSMWNKWCHHYDQTRNEVFHSGKEPSENEVRDTLEINEKVIKWVDSLP